jgi:hypothetical protein
MTARTHFTETKNNTEQALIGAADTAPVSAPPVTGPAKNQDAPAIRGIDIPGPHPSAKSRSTGRDGRVQINGLPGEKPVDMTARIGLSPTMLNAYASVSFTRNNPMVKISGTELDFGAWADMMVAKVNALAAGGTSQIEEQLLCQAATLEAAFVEMMRRASEHMGTPSGETYMRLGLKAQAQCRATLETLAEIKNPRPVFINAKQANVANGNQQVNNTQGPQQVNNGSAPDSATSRAGENRNPENELLEGPQ